MRYFNEDMKSVDKLEVNTKVSHDNRDSRNTSKCLIVSILLLPIFILMYFISLHSNDLINERLSVFSLIIIFILALFLSYGIINEFKRKKSIVIKLMGIGGTLIYMGLFMSVGTLLYGDDNTFRNFIIDRAMRTTNHQYLATWLYNQETIDEVLTETKEVTKVDFEGSKEITFEEIKYNQEVYANKYEEAILNKKNENDLYKIIDISGTTIGAKYKYRGYLVAVYDPSKVELATSSGAGTFNGSYGEILSVIAQKNNAEIAMNAGGFYDPYWNSNGGIPHGIVIKDGKVLSEFRRGINSGGLIGFTKDNKLVLKRMNAEEAIGMKIRDAVDWGPFLIVNGVNQFANVHSFTWATSRTVIGQRRDGIVLLLVIDGGNQPGSFGASYADAAKIMENYGAINAANLDGGTSTALVKNGKYINMPWNGHQRTIRSLPNAWIVKK